MSAAPTEVLASLLDDVKFDLRHPSSDDSQRFGGGMRDIDDASGNVRAAVIDPDRHGPAGGDVGDAHPRAERQRAVSGGQFARIEPFAASGLRLVPVEAGEAIPGI